MISRDKRMKGSVKILIIFGFLIFCGALMAATSSYAFSNSSSHSVNNHSPIMLAGIQQQGRGSYNQAQRLIPQQYRQPRRQNVNQVNIPHDSQRHIWVPKQQTQPNYRLPYDRFHTRPKSRANSSLY